jgi:hypothetical protein
MDVLAEGVTTKQLGAPGNGLSPLTPPHMMGHQALEDVEELETQPLALVVAPTVVQAIHQITSVELDRALEVFRVRDLPLLAEGRGHAGPMLKRLDVDPDDVGVGHADALHVGRDDLVRIDGDRLEDPSQTPKGGAQTLSSSLVRSARPEIPTEHIAREEASLMEGKEAEEAPRPMGGKPQRRAGADAYLDDPEEPDRQLSHGYRSA